jgi:hypothetical protein
VEVYQIEEVRGKIQIIRSLDALRVEDAFAKNLRGKLRMQVQQVVYNLDPLALNNSELNDYSSRGIAIAIVVNHDTHQVDRSREHDNQPQQRPTQISFNH